MVYILGATASGKTDLAMDLAWPTDSRVVNLDRHAFVRGMDIGTATPTAAEKQRVTHLLLDQIPLAEAPASPALLKARATEVINDCLRTSWLPVFVVGGSLRLAEELIYGGEVSLPDAAFVQALRAKSLRQLALFAIDSGYGLPFLHQDVHPLLHRTALRGDAARQARQLIEEHVLYRAFMRRRRAKPAPGTIVLGMDRPQPEVDTRIEARTDSMLQQGLLNEVNSLLQSTGGEWTDFLRRTIGYREFLPYFRGEQTLVQVGDSIRAATKRYARWQRSEFARRIPGIHWVGDHKEAANVLKTHFVKVARMPAHKDWSLKRNAGLAPAPKLQPSFGARLAGFYTSHLDPPKAIVFDIGGTLFPSVSWHALTRDMGASVPALQRLYANYRQGRTSYQDATRALLALWWATGNANKAAMTQIFRMWTLAPEAQHVIQAAREGRPVCLITGSMDAYAEVVAEKLGVHNWYANTTLLWDRRGDLVDINYEVRRSDRKLQQFGAFCRMYGLQPQDCMVVGDNENDMGMFALSRRGVLVGQNPAQEYANHAWRVVPTLSDVGSLL